MFDTRIPARIVVTACCTISWQLALVAD